MSAGKLARWIGLAVRVDGHVVDEAAVARAKVALPSGRVVDVARASTDEIVGAAKELRAARSARTGRTRGRTVTPDERGRAAALQARPRALGVRGARVTPVATRPGDGANVRIEAVPLDALDVLRRAIASVGAAR